MISLMGFDPRISGIKSNRSTNIDSTQDTHNVTWFIVLKQFLLVNEESETGLAMEFPAQFNSAPCLKIKWLGVSPNRFFTPTLTSS